MVFDNMNISIITYSVIMVIGTTQLYIFYIPSVISGIVPGDR